MQLTRFDRWLREKFAYETHVQTLRLPEVIPPSILVFELPETPGMRYRYLMISRHTKDTEQLINSLREQGMMYATQVMDRKAWYVRFVAPKTKSLTWWLFSTLVILNVIFWIAMYVIGLAEDPVFRKNFMEALQILKS